MRLNNEAADRERNGRMDQASAVIETESVTEFGSGEFTLYLYKERCTDSPSFTINSMADFEIPDEVARRAYIRQAMEHDFRCVKIVASLPNVPPKAEIEQAIDRL
ncbi:MAG: hypothetical protein KZQ96_07315, partial [Candidatus Thiodiazotropha sp. (ex Lucinoma borealis)]|nr:hypothetical protein [Candidatus Thiodiazotropha sp. (ex Lucinoma borealis)]